MAKYTLTPEQEKDKQERVALFDKMFTHSFPARRLLIYGGSRCFGGNTLVMTKNGFTEIKDVKPDDYVLTANGWTRVVKTFANKKDLIYNAFDNGYDLLISADHRIKTSKGWQEYGHYLEENTVIGQQIRSKQHRFNPHHKLEEQWTDEDYQAVKVCESALFEKYVLTSRQAIQVKVNSRTGSGSVYWHTTKRNGHKPQRWQCFEQQYRESGILHAQRESKTRLCKWFRKADAWRAKRNAQVIRRECALYQGFLSECEAERIENTVQKVASRKIWCQSSDYKRHMSAKKKFVAYDLETESGEYLIFTGFFWTVHNSSKTFRTLRKVLKRAVYYPNSRHLVARDTFTSLRKAIILDTMPKLLRIYYPQLFAHWNNGGFNGGTSVFTLPNGSEIHFSAVGNEKEVEKLLGTEYATIFLDEVSEINYEALQKLRTRLAQKVKHYKYERYIKLLEILVENPPHKGHWTYREHFLYTSPLDPDKPLNKELYANVRLNPLDNLEYLPDEYIDSLKELPAHEQTRFLYGEFGEEARGAVLAQEFAKYPDNIKQEISYNDRYPVYTAWDIGHTDATAICFYQWIDGRIKVIDYIEDTLKALPYFVDQLKAKNYKYDLVFFPHDGVNTEWAYGNTRVQRMIEMGFETTTLQRLLEQEQIDIARTMIPIIDIDRRLFRLIDCINNMRYDFKDGVMNTKNIVHDEYSHGGKAFLYLCQSIYKNREEKRYMTEQEKRDKLHQNILNDIRKGIEANKAQLVDKYDYTKEIHDVESD